jgi:thioredoxin-dependent peroxiredoxin
MNLSKGQKAPNFKTIDIWGNEIDLSKTDNQTTILTFFRYAECALCNLRISEIMRHKEDLAKKNIRLITIFESPAESLKSNVADRHQFGFTIIADQERKLYDLYQVKPSWLKLIKTMTWDGISSALRASKMGFALGGKVEGTFNQIPADFVINKNGIIDIAHYGDSVIDHIPLSVVLK